MNFFRLAKNSIHVKCVFLSNQFGLMIARSNEADFRVISEWTTTFADTIDCEFQCSESHYPTSAPVTSDPSHYPTNDPTNAPSVEPSIAPSATSPTISPSAQPSVAPTGLPTTGPTVSPSFAPTLKPRYHVSVEHHLSGVP